MLDHPQYYEIDQVKLENSLKTDFGNGATSQSSAEGNLKRLTNL